MYKYDVEHFQVLEKKGLRFSALIFSGQKLKQLPSALIKTSKKILINIGFILKNKSPYTVLHF